MCLQQSRQDKALTDEVRERAETRLVKVWQALQEVQFLLALLCGHRQSLGRVIGIEEVAGFYRLQRKKSCPKMQAGASVGLSLGLWLGTKPGLSSQGLLDSGFDGISNGTVGEYGPGLAVLKE